MNINKDFDIMKCNSKTISFGISTISLFVVLIIVFIVYKTLIKPTDFKIPENVMVICLGKSTYTKRRIKINVTPLEPGWEGYVTLEFSNTTPLPAKIYANEGAAQFVFIKGNEKPETSYSKRKGKYMKQKGVTLPKI